MEWELRSGEEISTLITKGESPGWQGFDYVDDGILFITSENVRDGSLDVSSPKFIPRKFHKKLQRSKLHENDVLINLVGASIGRSCLFENVYQEANINQAVCLIRPSEEAEPYWLMSYLQFPRAVKRLLEQQVNSARANISLQNLRDFLFPVPSLSEQRRIVAVLKTWDKAIERLGKSIAAKKQLEHGLMQQLLTGKRRFGGFESRTWRTCTLGEVASESNLRNNSRLSREMLLAVTKTEGMLPMRERVQGESVERCKIVRESWFAYNPMRLNIGSIAKWDGPQEAMVSGDYVVFRCHDGKLDPGFLDHYRKSNRWRTFVETAGIGSVRVRIWFSDLGRMRLRLPSIEEQRRIAEVLDACDLEISILTRQLQELRLQKKGLMQQLLIGKVRVTHLLNEPT